MNTSVWLTGVAQSGGGWFDILLPLVLIFGVFYLLVIRPQSKQRRVREKMLSELKVGDKVVMNAGIFGEVTGLKDGVVTLLISDKVRIRVLLSQIGGLESEFVRRDAEQSKK